MKLEDRPGIKKLEKAVNINWVKIAVLAVLACLCIKYSDHVIETIRLIVYTMRPLFYGLAIAYVLNIFMKKLEKIYFPKKTDAWVTKTRRPVCVFASIILVLVLAVMLIGLVVPSLLDAVHVITKDIPSAFIRFQKWLSGILENSPELQQYVDSLDIDWNSTFRKIGDFLSKGIGDLFNSAFSVYRTDFGYFFYLYALWKRTAAVPAEKACNGLCGGGDYRTGTAFSDSCK